MKHGQFVDIVTGRQDFSEMFYMISRIESLMQALFNLSICNKSSKANYDGLVAFYYFESVH